MPKMLSVWLDFGSDFNRDLKKKNNKTSLYLTERKRTFIKMTKLIGKLLNTLHYDFYLIILSYYIFRRVCFTIANIYVPDSIFSNHIKNMSSVGRMFYNFN